MKPELRKRIIAYNINVATNAEKANDLMTLLEKLPLGVLKQLLKDENCCAILEKYGITTNE